MHFRHVWRCERPGGNESISNVFFSSGRVNRCSQLLVFVRFIHSGDIKEKFLFCEEVQTTTTSADVLEKKTSFLILQSCSGNLFMGNGAHAMMESRLGFQKTVQKLAPEAKVTHYVIHRYALVSRTLPTPLKNVLDNTTRIVNYFKNIKTCLFKELCKDINRAQEVFSFHTSIRWLSKGNVLNRVFGTKYEIKLQ